jgi:hypothetical protein
LNILAFGAGSMAASRLARLWGSSSWLGLSFCLNPGVLSEMDISGGGVLALASALVGINALENVRPFLGALGLTVSVLSRETMLASAAVLAWILWRRGTQGWWAVVALPTATAGVWAIYIRSRLSGLPSTGPEIFASYPFGGAAEAFVFWSKEPLDLLMVFAFLGVCTAFLIRLLRSRQLLAWGSLPSLFLAAIASVSVWRHPYDIARVLAPVFVAYPILAFAANTNETSALEMDVQ